MFMDIILYRNYIARLSEEIEVQTVSIREAAKQVNLKRDELIGMVKKRKTLEKLKEKDQLAYRKKLMLLQGPLHVFLYQGRRML